MPRLFFRTATLLIVFAFGFGLTLFTPAPASADYSDAIRQQTKAFAGDTGAGLSANKDPRVIAAQVIRYFLGFVGTLFLVYTVYAGYLWLTAAGAEDKIDKAKSTLRTAMLGILVTVGAYAIVTFFTNVFLNATRDRQTGGFQMFIDIQDQDRLRMLNPDPLTPPNTTPFEGTIRIEGGAP